VHCFGNNSHQSHQNPPIPMSMAMTPVMGTPTQHQPFSPSATQHSFQQQHFPPFQNMQGFIHPMHNSHGPFLHPRFQPMTPFDPQVYGPGQGFYHQPLPTPIFVAKDPPKLKLPRIGMAVTPPGLSSSQRPRWRAKNSI
jgi:hypothetical protein